MQSATHLLRLCSCLRSLFEKSKLRHAIILLLVRPKSWIQPERSYSGCFLCHWNICHWLYSGFVFSGVPLYVLDVLFLQSYFVWIWIFSTSAVSLASRHSNTCRYLRHLRCFRRAGFTQDVLCVLLLPQTWIQPGPSPFLVPLSLLDPIRAFFYL